MLKKAAELLKLPITAHILLWLLLVFSLSPLADRVITYSPSFPYVETHLAITGLPRSIYSWANFDGVHYITIAREGHITAKLVQAFFPVYPLLLSVAPKLGTSFIEFGILINVLLSIVFVYVWYYAQREDRVKPDIAKHSITAFLLFPTSFFLVSVYTESLFLCLTVLTFLAVSKKQWLLASICIGIASATRFVGIMLVPAVLFHILEGDKILRPGWVTYPVHVLKQFRIHFWKVLSVLLIGSSGLIGYMYFLYQHFADALYFIHVQPEFGSNRQDTIVLLPQVLYRYAKILATYRPFGLIYFATAQELFLSVLILGALLFAWKKKLVPTYQILFSILAWILPTLTGTLSSMPRYVLVALPAFTAFGWLLTTYPRVKLLWIVCSTFFLVFNTILFVQGYWVA